MATSLHQRLSQAAEFVHSIRLEYVMAYVLQVALSPNVGKRTVQWKIY